MNTPEQHTVNGTLFTFPELPGAEASGEELHARFTAERQAVLDKARAAKFKPAALPRAVRTPKPGNGTFTPKAGAAGSAVTVKVHVVERDKYAVSELFTEEREGCVMFPAPGPAAVWVSLWDGQMPVCVRLDGDKAAGSVCLELAEYEHRFGPRRDFPCCAGGAA
jgi:hypothetical protein